MRKWTLFVLAAVGAGVFGCSFEPLGPSLVETDNVEVTVKADPVTIAPGDSTEIRVEYRNKTNQDVVLSFGMGCPFYLTVLNRRTEESIPLKGTVSVCVAVGSSITVPAMESVIQVAPLIAEVNGRLAEPGRYVAQLDFTNGLWDLEVGLEID